MEFKFGHNREVQIRFIDVVAGMREYHVRDIIITKEAPNYRLE